MKTVNIYFFQSHKIVIKKKYFQNNKCRQINGSWCILYIPTLFCMHINRSARHGEHCKYNYFNHGNLAYIILELRVNLHFKRSLSLALTVQLIYAHT